MATGAGAGVATGAGVGTTGTVTSDLAERLAGVLAGMFVLVVVFEATISNACYDYHTPDLFKSQFFQPFK